MELWFVWSIILFLNFQHKNLGEIKQILKETQLEESRKRDLSSALHACFKDWLYCKIYQVIF